MRVAVFSTQFYDREYFDKFNTTSKHQLTYFDVALNIDTAKLALGFEAICAFSNDKIDSETIKILARHEIRVIVLRCAGFNNVDYTTIQF